MVDNRDKILQTIRMRGPVIPFEISKVLETNVLFASAMLSELVDKGLLKLSALKVGGSPVYYLPGQEIKLQNFSNKLNDREKTAFDMLRQKVVLRDRSLEPVIRVALRSIKDFAVPLQVNAGEVKEIFWKWYLTPDSQAEVMIKQVLGLNKKEPEVKEIPKEEIKIEEPKIEIPKPKVELPKRSEVKVEKKEIKEEVKEEPKPIDFVDKTDHFSEKIHKYFQENDIAVLDAKIIKKKTDFEFVIKVPSNVGKITYFCMAKNKKKFNEKDVNAIFVQGQMKKMPVLLLTNGDLSKKAEEIIEKEFRNVTVKKI